LPPSLDHELLDFLSWDELRQLSHAGFEIGSHTVTHPILSRCTPDHVRAELRDSKAAIEQATGRPCYVLAYPNGMPGDYTAETEAIAAETGFRLAFAVHDCLAPASASRFAITRVSVPGHFPRSVFAARASGTWHLLRGSA
jgi:peptidoglycan/xylan/chitin deacetylase (PgdA/CDA1 family)